MSSESYVANRRRGKRRAAQYGHGWLAAVLPADAGTFRVTDPHLAGALEHAGAELVKGAADVEIGAAHEEVFGDAALVIVSIDPPARVRRPRLVRAVRRLGASARTRLTALVGRRDLHRLGYPHTGVLLWDVGQRTRLPGIPTLERNLAERLPERALVLGRRGPRRPTALQAALEAAGEAVGAKITPSWASIRSGTLIVATDAGLLRVAIGYARSQIESHVAMMQALGAIDFPPIVAERIPWLVAHGRTGLADWSLERILPGTRPPRSLTPELNEECLDFLVELHASSSDGPGTRSTAELADTVAAVCTPDQAAVVRAVGERLERDLAGVPRGFGHGDFFAGNLLTTSGRLTGVIDWDAASLGRPPLVDLLHLETTRIDYGFDHEWGRALVDRVLPLARAGGNELLRRYCERIGIDPDPVLLETLVVAYWLDYVAYQLRTHLDRHRQLEWIDGNVAAVLRELEPFARGGAGASHPGNDQAP